MSGSKMKIKKIILLTSVFLNSFFCFGQVSLQSQAPDFILQDIKGNKWSSSEQLNKKLSIILFWATWGNDSVEMLDQVQHLVDKYHEKGLEAVGICVENQNMPDSTIKKIFDLAINKKISFPILIDHELQTFRKYGVIAVPTTFAVDSTGKIVHHLSGFPLLGREDFIEFVQEYFDGKKVITVHHKFDRQPDKHALRLYNMASMKFNRGELDTAKKYALDAAAIDSAFIEPIILLSNIAVEENNIPLSDYYITKALKILPSSVEVQALSGLIIAKKGDTLNAEKILRKILEQTDTIAIAHCYLGYLKGITGNIDAFEVEMDKAAQLSPTDYRIPFLRAEIYEKLDKKKEAQELRRKAKQLRRSR